MIFDSTTHFLQSEIRPVFRSFRKCLVKSNLCGIISPRGEKCGLKAVQTDLAVLSGYMKKISPWIVVEYRSRILNIHPSLLPRHGGKGMYGDRVHLAVLQSGDTQSGATVHLLSEEYDEGSVLLQREVAVTVDETLESLKSKVRQLEGPLCIEAISKFMHNHALQSDAATQRR
ncbi:MAG: formyltransferase family protein [Gammaproteobacteria bacterium]